LKYSIEHISGIVQGSFLHFHRNDTIEHLLSDSRKLIFPETTLFFALKGPRRDGEQFIEELYQRGVRNFVLAGEAGASQYKEANIIIVGDVLQALQQLAAYGRDQFDIPVIGITGSNGKTIVKEWLNQLLEDRYNIVRSPRSYNSQIGVPLSVWQMNELNELGIFEAGISHPGEMQKLEKIIRPTLGILTNIGEAHGENFAHSEEKTGEKIKLFKNSSVVFYPADDRKTATTILAWKDAAGAAQGKTIELFSWGKDQSARVNIKKIEKKEDNTVIDISYDDAGIRVIIPFTDDASIENAMVCICVLFYLKIPVTEILTKLVHLSPIAMRLELKSGINHCSIINDSYSADLSSLKIALDFLEQQHQHVKRTVILSDILQSGKPANELYEEVARSLQQKKVNRLIGIGKDISAHQEIFQQWKINETSFYNSVDEFKKNFYQLLFRDETILIKGARLFEFEKIDRLLAEQIHQTVLEINLDAMTHNLKQYQQLLRPATKLMGMVKAFAYGSGSYEIANLLQFHKVDYLAVAYTDEAVELRKAGINMPVMVMNVDDSSFDALLQYNLEPVIYSFRLFELFDKFLKREGLQQFPVHIELETGMNRLGFTSQEIARLCEVLKNSFFKIQTVFSHLAASEETQQDEFTKQQASLFVKAADEIQAVVNYPFLKHIANSAAISRHPELQFDMVRLGIGLYGIDSGLIHQAELREVSALKSTIAQIKQLKDGETIGYNRKGVAEGERVIATVRIGYADGYPRTLGNGNGKMWVNGHLAPVTGSICMDMTMIDITGIPHVQEGDEVIVFGKELPVSQVAHLAQTIPYEILTGVSQRVKRIYYEE
jgi:alanine racemase